VDGLALDAGIEEGGTGDEFGPSSADDGCGKDEQEGKKVGYAEFGRVEHDSLSPGNVHLNGLRCAGKIRDFKRIGLKNF